MTIITVFLHNFVQFQRQSIVISNTFSFKKCFYDLREKERKGKWERETLPAFIPCPNQELNLPTFGA